MAEGKKVAEIDKDVQDLIAKWTRCYDILKTAKPQQKLLGEMDRTATILRDMLNPNFNAIHVNDHVVSEEIKIAVNQLDSITGRNIDVDLIDKIFSQFCIGK